MLRAPMSSSSRSQDSAPTVVWQNGELVPFAGACVPLEDRGLQFGESLYEVLPITAGKVRALGAHAARMRRGADRIGIGAAPSDAQWETLSAALLKAEGVTDALLYAQLTGGRARRAHYTADRPTPSFWAYLMPFDYPTAQDVERGIRAATAPDPRWAHCDLKTTLLLPAVMAKYEAHAKGADEALFVDDGQLREGASSNAFIVERGAVIGVPQGSSILPGITRQLMEKTCQATDTPLRSEPVPLARLFRSRRGLRHLDESARHAGGRGRRRTDRQRRSGRGGQAPRRPDAPRPRAVAARYFSSGRSTGRNSDVPYISA